MISARTLGFAAALALTAAFSPLPGGFGTAQAVASEIKYLVNNVPITSYDIQRRAAFIRLQHAKASAADQMIEQTLRNQEIARLGIRVSDQEVDQAFANFAKGNKLTPSQLNQIFAKSGVTTQHFKDYIRAQMGWSRALASRSRAEGTGGITSEQQAVRKMMQKDGQKPKATEYMLQQVIFVVPKGERGSLLAKRKREAEAMRQRFQGCDSTRSFAKGLIDVTVRDLGRVLEPQLPSDWAEPIKNTKTGGATIVRETERGVEFIGICSAREVSDDRVAQLTLQAEASKGADSDTAQKLSKTYTEELRKKAKIVQR
ncbi:MAG: peptidylprolyl isomerase [Rhizobiales bacterium]|nr:peptidylprolyl isomerase [Hyphomicrobiales bacterium]